MNINNKYNDTYIITICSGKGGVGKSVIAANLAYSIAKSPNKVLLIDADINFPNTHLLLGIDSILQNSHFDLDNDDISNVITKVNNNFSILSNSTLVNGNTEQGSILKILDSVKREGNFDFIVIDTPPGVSNDIIDICNFSDLIELIVTDEPTSLMDGFGLLKVLRHNTRPRKKGYNKNNGSNLNEVNLIINNAIDTDDASEIATKMNMITEKFLDFNITINGFIPYDRLVRKSILSQHLFTELYPESGISQAVNSIAKKLIEKKINSSVFESILG